MKDLQYTTASVTACLTRLQDHAAAVFVPALRPVLASLTARPCPHFTGNIVLQTPNNFQIWLDVYERWTCKNDSHLAVRLFNPKGEMPCPTDMVRCFIQAARDFRGPENNQTLGSLVVNDLNDLRLSDALLAQGGKILWDNQTKTYHKRIVAFSL